MKTIRTNCFETNSSSTHSFTVSAPTNMSLKPTQTFLPNEEGVIAVQLNNGDPSDSPLGKLTFLLSAAYHLGDQAAYDRVAKVVYDFTKLNIVATVRSWSNEQKWQTIDVGSVSSYESDDERKDHIRGEFYSWVCGHNQCVDDFVDEVYKIVENEQAILVFIFTNHAAFGREVYYDG